MKYLLALLLVSTISGYSISQNQRIYRKYATQQVYKRLSENNLVIKKSILSIDESTEDWKSKDRKKPFVIPVVFHILTAQGQYAPSDIDLYLQIKILNTNFASLGSPENLTHPSFSKENFKDKLSSTDISFCLAADKNKNSPSIIRKTISKSAWTCRDSMKFSKLSGDDAWKKDDYLNIWIVYLTDDIAGYAQMPGGEDATDGIVIDTRYFGFNTPINYKYYNEGKTLVHLMGNFLGLYDLWNEELPCTDDHVNDTPIHNGPTNGSADYYGYVSTCNEKPIAMTMNFMDNTDDRNLFMFTYGQMTRMQAILSDKGLRDKLGKSNKNVCNASNLLYPEIRSLNIASSFSAFPNPANTELNIDYKNMKENKQLVIYNSLGQVTYFLAMPNESQSDKLIISTATWQSGMYYILLSDSNQKFNQKVIVSH
ncbi:MAG: M43 family zinc metalloprotease [Saprospiraceae bacterium]